MYTNFFCSFSHLFLLFFFLSLSLLCHLLLLLLYGLFLLFDHLQLSLVINLLSMYLSYLNCGLCLLLVKIK